MALEFFDVETPFDIVADYVEEILDRPDVAELVRSLRVGWWHDFRVIESRVDLYWTRLYSPSEKCVLVSATESEAYGIARKWIEERLKEPQTIEESPK